MKTRIRYIFIFMIHIPIFTTNITIFVHGINQKFVFDSSVLIRDLKKLCQLTKPQLTHYKYIILDDCKTLGDYQNFIHGDRLEIEEKYPYIYHYR